MGQGLGIVEGAKPRWAGDVSEKKALGNTLRFLTKIAQDLNRTATPASDLLKPLLQFEMDVADFRPDYENPLNKIAIFLAHNAYNVVGTGATSILPSQSLSFTEMLARGIRAFELDVHEVNDELLLCHRVCNTSIWSGLDLIFGANRKLADTLQEIGRFILSNPNEIVIVKIEDHLTSPGGTSLAKFLTDTFGEQKIFTGTELTQFLKEHGGIWPSLGELAERGKSLIFTTENLTDPHPLFVNTPHNEAFSLITYKSVHQAVEAGFQNLTPTSSQLAEVGEDKTPILGDFRSLWGYLPGVKASGGGKFTKEQIDQLRAQTKQQGVMIDLDHISQNDYRVQKGDYGLTTVSGLLVNLKENGFIFVPVALLGGVLSAIARSEEEDSFTKKLLSDSTDLAIKLLIYATLPTAGKFLYETTRGAFIAYKDSSSTQIQEQMKAVDEGIIRRWGGYLGRGLASAADITARVLLTQGIQALRQASGYTFDDNPSELATHVVMDTMIANNIVTGAENTARYLWHKLWPRSPS